MLLVEDPNTGISKWLINPHTTDYLVGSASLAAFSGEDSYNTNVCWCVYFCHPYNC